MCERNREDLIRTTRLIELPRFAVAIDDVVEITACFKPEALVERSARLTGASFETLGLPMLSGLPEPARQQFERVIPERVNLDRFAPTRRDDPVAHFRVHPGELHPFLALHEQAVVRI